MYIWALLATFIAIIASFNIPVRPDIRKLSVSARAEPIFTRMVIQHISASEYIQNNFTIDGTNKTISFDVGPSGNKIIAYQGDEVTLNEYEEYLPYSFNHVDEAFYTFVYCLDRKAPNRTSPIDCTSVDAEHWLLTYNCVPLKWRDIETGKPNADLVASMENFSRGHRNFGYAEELTGDRTSSIYENSLDSTMAIIRDRRNSIPIPQYIIDTDMGPTSFNKICRQNQDTCPYCLTYLSVITASTANAPPATPPATPPVPPPAP